MEPNKLHRRKGNQMARRKVLVDPKEFSISLEKELYQELERLSERTGMSVSRLGRNLLIMGLEDLHILEATGLLTIVLKFNDYREKLRDAREACAELDGSVCF